MSNDNKKGGIHSVFSDNNAEKTLPESNVHSENVPDADNPDNSDAPVFQELLPAEGKNTDNADKQADVAFSYENGVIDDKNVPADDTAADTPEKTDIIGDIQDKIHCNPDCRNDNADGNKNEHTQTVLSDNGNVEGEKTSSTDKDDNDNNPTFSSMGKSPDNQSSSGGRWGRIFLWVMVIGLAALLLSITFGGNSISKAALEVKGEGSVRIGDSYRYSAEVVNYKGRLKDGLSVIWTVNGKDVKKSTAGDKNAFVFDYKPETKGNYTIGVKIGNYSNLSESKAVTVKNPLITVTMDSKTMTYGQERPDFTYNINGMRGDDTAEGINLVITPALEKEMTGAGEYVINGTASAVEGYDVEVIKGTLKVNPKCVSVEEKHLTKVYDGTTDCPGCITAPLSGVLEGDEVILEGKVSFDSASVGKNKAVSFRNASLIGKDSDNYTIAGRTMTGTITAKTVTLSSLTAADKIFDGTTNVTFTSVGTLDGVIDGDEVAIGEIKAHFENASVGTKCRIIIDEIVLIGRDAKNYKVDVNLAVTADIKAIASVTGKRK